MKGDAFAVIWDMDGTLVDTAEMHFAAWQELAGRRGLTFTLADFHATFGRRNPDILPELFGDRLSEQEIVELGDEKEELYRQAVREKGVVLLPGASALVAQVADHGLQQAIGSVFWS